MAYTVLIFDNRPDTTQTLASAIEHKFGYRTVAAASPDYGIRWIMSDSQPQPDLVLIDMVNSGTEILQIIRQVKACKPQLPVIVMMQYGNDDYAIPIINAGANDFLIKPLGIERLKLSMQNALKVQHMSDCIARLERKYTNHTCLDHLMGHSEAFKHTIRMAEKAAGCDAPVWIEGEQGTGRESVARAIHGSGARAGKAFIVIDCERMKPAEAETILFGSHDGKTRPKMNNGLLTAACGGTAYFHEVSKLPANVHQRLAETLKRPIDTRIICNDSKNAARNTLSHSLYDMLTTLVIAVPSLRQRREDIPTLAQHFLNMHAASENRFPALLCDDALQSLESHPWPGNIRQLGNLMHRAVLLSQLDQVDAATLRLVRQLEPVHYEGTRWNSDTATFFDPKGQVKKLRSIETDAIKLAIRQANGCMTKAARALGIGRSTLYRKIDEMEETGDYISRENQTTRPIMPAAAGELS